MSEEKWQSSPEDQLQSHQCRDKLSRLCTSLGIPLDRWLSVRAIEAIEFLLHENKQLKGKINT